MKKAIIKTAFRLFLTAFAAAVPLSAACAASAEAEKEIRLFKENRISSVVEFETDARSGAKIKKSLSVYDKNGLKKEFTLFKNDGKTVEKRTEYSYDTDANEIMRKEYNKDGLIISQCESHYDAEKKLSKEAFFDAKNELVKVKTFTYDDKKNPIEQRILDKDGKYISKIVTGFNEANLKTSVSTYDASEKLVSKWSYSYDDKQNITEASSYDKNDRLTGKWIYAYEKSGLLSSMTGYNSKNAPTLTKSYEYTKFRPEPNPNAGPRETVTFIDNAAASAARSETGEDISPQAFILAAEFGTPEELDEKFEKGKFDINFQDESGWTALTAAAAFGNKDAVEYLLSKGANAGIKDKEGLTPLDHAKRHRRTEVIKLLTGGGAK